MIKRPFWGTTGCIEVEDNFESVKKLVRFCIEHWDNRFIEEIEEDLQEQKEALEPLQEPIGD